MKDYVGTKIAANYYKGKDGVEHKFVVYHRDDIIEFIESKKSV